MCGVLYPHPRLDLSASVLFISLEEGKKKVPMMTRSLLFFVRRLNPRRFVGTLNDPICAVLVLLRVSKKFGENR